MQNSTKGVQTQTQVYEVVYPSIWSEGALSYYEEGEIFEHARVREDERWVFTQTPDQIRRTLNIANEDVRLGEEAWDKAVEADEDIDDDNVAFCLSAKTTARKAKAALTKYGLSS